MDDGPVAVLGDGDEREDGGVDGDVLEEGAEGAHEVGQVPPLQQRRLEVEGDVEGADDEVGQRQVGDEEVGDGAHPTAPHHHVDHQRVACDKEGDLDLAKCLLLQGWYLNHMGYPD